MVLIWPLSCHDVNVISIHALIKLDQVLTVTDMI